MANVIPVKATFTSNTVTGLAEFQSGDTIDISTYLSSSSITFAGDSGSDSASLGETLTIAGGTNITTAATSNTITINLDSNVVTETSTDTLTNKSIDLANNTITGTTAEFNSALSDGSFATLAGTETLTNKTISGASNTLSNIANSSLTNSSITIGSDSISLGATQTDLNGITSLDVDNITIDGSTISTTNINGDLTLNPNGSGDVALSSDTIKYGDPDSTDTVFRNAGSGTLSIQNTTIADNLIELNSGAASNANDTGILIERGSTGDNAIMAWDESADKFIFGTTTATASDTGDLTIASGTIVASTFEGALSGNATTATTLETARTIAGQSFDGSANISIASTDLS